MKRTKKLALNQALSLLPTRCASEEIRDLLREKIDLSLLAMVDELFAQELRALCGERYEHGKTASCKRAGSEKGSIYWDGQRKKRVVIKVMGE
ncbi:MAG: hypothetical protein IID05_03720 [Gemmatimonadetes bacterium]|nr:hypothetical protein [Gemmatimonadota bacterium]